MANPTWKIGDRVTINRRIVATVERLTPSGRVVVRHGDNLVTFEPCGTERASGYSRRKIAHLTPEAEAEIALVARCAAVFPEAWRVVEAAERWVRHARPAWGKDIAEVADVDRAERLIAAIEAVLPEVKRPKDGGGA